MESWEIRKAKTQMPFAVETLNIGKLNDLVFPQVDDVLWRFMDLAKFLSIIQTGGLYFARVDQFDDPFEGARGAVCDEGKYLSMMEEALKELYESPQIKNKPTDEYIRKAAVKLRDAWRISGLAERHMQTSFVSCWHHNKVESDAMWRLYTKDLSQGIAIQTTCGRLQESLAKFVENQKVTIAFVNYIDYSTPLGPSDNPCWFKRESFKHECEVRALCHIDSNTNDLTGLVLKVDPSILIENVYISPMASMWFKTLVIDVIGKYGLDVPIRQSVLMDKGFR